MKGIKRNQIIAHSTALSLLLFMSFTITIASYTSLTQALDHTPYGASKVESRASLTITNIPKIMRSKDWQRGASLMETWFSRNSAITPNYTSTDTTTIRMDWIIKFRTAKKIYDELLNERVWINEPAQKEIARMLRRKGLLRGKNVRSFGNLSFPVDKQDADYINFRKVTYELIDTNLDDLFAALGRFVFRVVVAGTVQQLEDESGYQVAINEVGIYVYDSYDFQDDGLPHLGFWNETNDCVSLTSPNCGTMVTNATFREWRAKNGKGGDFLIFSDLKRIQLEKPDSFIIK